MTDASVPDSTDRVARQAAAFDAIGSRYDEAFPHKDGQRRAVEQLLTLLPRPARVLDAGCGTGQPTARQLVDAGCEVTGIDVSPVMLELARGNVPEATLLQRDVLSIDASLGRFDAAVSFFTLLMLPRDQIRRALARLREVLVPSGWLALGMVEADLDDVEISFLGQPVRVSGWLRDQLRQVVTEAGFSVETEDVREYAPAAPTAPPEVQLFLLARRTE